MPNLLFFVVILVINVSSEQGSSSLPRVFLTISSTAKRINNNVIMERQVEMNWFDNNPNSNGSWIGLFDHDPSETIEDPLEKIDVTNETVGYYKTNFMFPKITFPMTNLTNGCLYYWIAYITSNQIVCSSCYRSRPHWMAELREYINNSSLSGLMIPGTHNSACYHAYNPNIDNLFTRYLITQDESIWNQLMYGNRFLDIRITYHGNQFWIAHSFLKINILLSEVIEHVRTFINLTEEIVVLDFHRFENGFQGTNSLEVHRSLIQYLEEQLGNVMIPYSYGYNVPLNMLWETNRRLYVGYAHSMRWESDYLFPGVSHQWANTDLVEDLERYFNDTVCLRVKRNLQSSMAHLTPKPTGILFNTYNGLRTMAQNVNLKVTEWFYSRWWDCANIVASDYFHGNDIIEVAIEANRKRQLQG